MIRKKESEGGPGSGGVGAGSKHDDLKYVYEQIENIKMHFEAQIEQLYGELHATKDEVRTCACACCCACLWACLRLLACL